MLTRNVVNFVSPRHRLTGVVNGSAGTPFPNQIDIFTWLFESSWFYSLDRNSRCSLRSLWLFTFHSLQTNKQTKNKQILSEKIQYSSALVVQTHVHLKSINAILHLVMLLLSRYVNRRATIQLYTERVDVIFSRHAKIMSKQNISLNSYAF